jgi:hypothetical protein
MERSSRCWKERLDQNPLAMLPLPMKSANVGKSCHGKGVSLHPLAAMLAAVCCAILCGARGFKPIARWLQDEEISTAASNPIAVANRKAMQNGARVNRPTEASSWTSDRRAQDRL